MNEKWLYDNLPAAEERYNLSFSGRERKPSADLNRKIEAFPQKRISKTVQTLVAAVLMLCLTGGLLDFLPVKGDTGMIHVSYGDYGTTLTLDADSSVQSEEIRILPEVLAEHYVHRQKRSDNWYKYFAMADNRSYHYHHDEDENKRLVILQQSIPYTSRSYGYLEEDWMQEFVGGIRVRYASYYRRSNGKGQFVSDAYWYEDNCMVIVSLTGGNEKELWKIIESLLEGRE